VLFNGLLQVLAIGPHSVNLYLKELIRLINFLKIWSRSESRLVVLQVGILLVRGWRGQRNSSVRGYIDKGNEGGRTPLLSKLGRKYHPDVRKKVAISCLYTLYSL
jgi:hypothetical protein